MSTVIKPQNLVPTILNGFTECDSDSQRPLEVRRMCAGPGHLAAVYTGDTSSVPSGAQPAPTSRLWTCNGHLRHEFHGWCRWWWMNRVCLVQVCGDHDNNFLYLHSICFHLFLSQTVLGKKIMKYKFNGNLIPFTNHKRRYTRVVFSKKLYSTSLGAMNS